MENITASYGTRITDIDLKSVPLSKIIDAIKTGGKNKELIEKIRSTKNKDERQRLKRQLPYINLGKFRSKRENSSLISTEFMVFDLDNLPFDSVHEFKDQFIRDERALLCFISPSGNGLKIAYRFDKPVTDPEHYKKLYKHYSVELIKQAVADHTCDPARACFISYDPEIYYNPDPQKLSTDIKFEDEPINDYGTNTKTLEMLSPAQQNVIDKLIDVCATIEKGKRSEQDFSVVMWAIRFGLSDSETYNLIKDVGKFAESGKPYFENTWKNGLIEYTREKSQTEIQNNSNQSISESPQFTNPESTPEVKFRIYTAYELQQMDFSETNWIIEDFLPEGLTILAGRPKSGKSWLALNLATAIAFGGVALSAFPTTKAEVLFISFEDTYKRLKNRLARMIEPDKDFPQELHITNEFSELKEAGEEHIRLLANENPNLKLIVIDTLERFIKRAGKETYSDDYLVTAQLQQIALETGVAILVIHHTRKMKTDEPLDDVSGTSGITGAADSIFVLRKHKDLNILSIKGRDIEETEYALEFAKENGLWVVEGKADEVAKTKEQQEIIQVLKKSDFPLSPKEIAESLEKSHPAVKMLLSRMYNAGIVDKHGGLYYVGNNAK